MIAEVLQETWLREREELGVVHVRGQEAGIEN